MNAADMFEDAGLETLEAANADEAIRLLEKHAQDVAALFTDINMPASMDGLNLARVVHECWPHIVPVVTSERARLRDDDILDSGRFVDKPDSLSEVLGIIREASV